MSEGSKSPARTRLSTPVLTSLWAGLAVLVIAAAIITISQVNARVFSAERYVEDYVSALAAGDGATALGMLEQQEVSNQAVLLDGEALSSSMERLGDIDVGTAKKVDDGYAVPLSFTVDKTAQEAHIEVAHAGTSWLFFDRWVISEPLSQIQVTSDQPSSTLLVNGVPAPLQEGSAALTTFVPAAVNVTDDGKYLAASAKTAVVDSGNARVALELTPQPTEELTDMVNADLKKFLDECAAQKVLQPSGCPLAHRTTERVDSSTIDWSISQYPQAKIERSGESWSVPTMGFVATLKYTGVDLMTGQSREHEVDVESQIAADIKVAPNQYYVHPKVPQDWLDARNSTSY